MSLLDHLPARPYRRRRRVEVEVPDYIANHRIDPDTRQPPHRANALVDQPP